MTVLIVSCAKDDINPDDNPSGDIDITSITINEVDIDLAPGESLQLTVTISPEDATNQTLTWTIVNDSIAEVNDEGLVIAKKLGLTTVTVETNNNLTAESEVTVKFPEPTGQWAVKAGFSNGIGLYDAVNFSIGTKGYVVTGSDYEMFYDHEYWGETGEEFKKEVWEYNSEIDEWRQLADFPGEERAEAMGFSLNGKGYLGLGKNTEGFLKDFWQFDPISDSWIRLGDFPGDGRASAVGFTLDGKAYAGLGTIALRDSGTFQDFWEFDPLTNNWTQLPDFPGGKRSRALGFGVNDNAYVGTGRIANAPPFSGALRYDLWQYSPSSNSWTRKADFITGEEYTDENRNYDKYGRERATTFVLGDKAYIGMGHKMDVFGGYSVSDFWKYDPVGDIWLPVNSIGYRARNPFNFVLEGRAFVGGGLYENFTSVQSYESFVRPYLYGFIP